MIPELCQLRKKEKPSYYPAGSSYSNSFNSFEIMDYVSISNAFKIFLNGNIYLVKSRLSLYS